MKNGSTNQRRNQARATRDVTFKYIIVRGFFSPGSMIGMLVKSLKDLPTVIATDRAEIREVLHPKNDPIGNHLSLAHGTVKKGQETKNHVLEIVEIYYILSGQGVMTIDREQRKVKKNDAIYVHPGSEQRIKNVGDLDLRFLVICAPPFSEDKSRVVE